MIVASHLPDHHASAGALSPGDSRFSKTSPILAGRILVVEDDPRMQRMLSTYLTRRGFRVQVECSGEQAVMAAAEDEFDVVLLDMTLPGINGLEVCEQIREWSSVAVILLTGVDTPQSKMAALIGGADDYVTKPFHIGELEARIGAVMRRTRPIAAQPALIEIDDLTIDLPKREVRRGGEVLHLTKIEFGLLRELVTHLDRLLTYEQLMRAVWGGENFDVRPLHVHMCNLRRKLQAGASAPRRIIGVTGVGYRFRYSD